jgi:hypothetical protein
MSRRAVLFTGIAFLIVVAAMKDSRACPDKTSSISQSAVTFHRVAAFCFTQRYGSLISPLCSWVSITLPASS